MRTKPWQIVLHARAPSIATGPSFQIGEHSLTSLLPTPGQLGEPFAVSFEEALEALEQLPRMFIEPDGSFVWTGLSQAADEASQVDGLLVDHQGRLATVELKGAAPSQAWDALLSAVGWPATPILVQLAREGVYLGESDFRRCYIG